MYVDLAVNENGDLVFEDSNPNYVPLHLKFSLTKTKAQKITFAIKKAENVEHFSNDYLKVSFSIKNNEQSLSTKIYKGDEALIQLISLQLNDTLGELAFRTEYGSRLNEYKHKTINDSNLKALEIYLTEFLSDYLYNPIVKATPKINYSNGYKQQVIISIYNNEDFLLNYVLES